MRGEEVAAGVPPASERGILPRGNLFIECVSQRDPPGQTAEEAEQLPTWTPVEVSHRAGRPVHWQGGRLPLPKARGCLRRAGGGGDENFWRRWVRHDYAIGRKADGSASCSAHAAGGGWIGGGILVRAAAEEQCCACEGRYYLFHGIHFSCGRRITSDCTVNETGEEASGGKCPVESRDGRGAARA